jgi:PAS domain-containing protein
VIDITGRKMAEAALRTGDENYRALFENIDEGFCIVEVLFDDSDRPMDCLFVEVNSAFERHTGITGACGKTMRGLLVSRSDCGFDAYGAIVRSDEPVRMTDYSHSLGRWFEIHAFRVGDFAPNRVALVFNNITERKQIETTQSLQMSQLETLLRKAPMGVYMVDADFRIRHVNPAALPVFGGIDGPVGRDFDEVVHALWDTAYADELVAIFRHALATGESHVETERSDARLGSAAREFYAWRADRIRFSDGRYGVVCYFRDVSNEVLARRALAESEERQSYLLALSDALRPLADPADIQCVAATLLGRQLRVSRAFYYEVDERSGFGMIARDYLRPGEPSLTGRHRFIDFTESHQVMRAGRTLIVADASVDPLFDVSERANYEAIGIQACIGVPLVKDGCLVAALGGERYGSAQLDHAGGCAGAGDRRAHLGRRAARPRREGVTRARDPTGTGAAHRRRRRPGHRGEQRPARLAFAGLSALAWTTRRARQRNARGLAVARASGRSRARRSHRARRIGRRWFGLRMRIPDHSPLR